MSLNVLIVDDSGVMRSMILKSLQLAGLPLGEVHQASNGQEGLGVLDNEWVDLIVADINMPVMNGEEMIRRIRSNELWANLPIVVISTEGSEARIQELQQLNTSFIHKPFKPETIRDVVQALTEFDHEFEREAV